jgi:hypothetical protein
MASMKIKVHEATSVMDVYDLLQDRGYTPAEDVDAVSKTVAYKEIPTGLDVPSVVTIVVTCYDDGEFDTEVVAASYDEGCSNGNGKDLYTTFIYANGDVSGAEKAINNAERAAETYIHALKVIYL